MRTILLILWSIEILMNVGKKKLISLKIFIRFKKNVIVLINDPFFNPLAKYKDPPR